MMKIAAVSAVVLFSMLLANPAAAAPARVGGLVNPESAVAGPDGRVYVSEIGEFGKDGDGRITVIDANRQGQVFATGMNDPKGLTFAGNILYVADKTRVLKITPDGKWQVFAAAADFPAPVQFLNDVETDAAGNVYVSDSGDLKGKGGAIYRISQGGKVTLITNGDKDARLLSPNGLLMDGKDHLLEVDFVSGILYRLHIASGAMEQVAAGFGGGDGIVRVSKEMLYVSDWKNGRVFSISNRGEVKQLQFKFVAAADIGLSGDGKYLLVPDMKAGELVWLPFDGH